MKLDERHVLWALIIGIVAKIIYEAMKLDN